MTRQTNQELFARRREVMTLAHKGWTQVAIAGHLKIPQCTVSRDLADMRGFWRDFPIYDFANVGGRVAVMRKNARYARIMQRMCRYLHIMHRGENGRRVVPTPLCVRACRNFSKKRREIMGFETTATTRTQVIAAQSEAATASPLTGIVLPLKIMQVSA